ncbi:hypothetical protein RchiOBHm_Chr2g0139011 [Rosa chinensis]|uniref:Uncharacterized protein n=1 Tax=Rosa chinensis TaxID=74649 RepID=A0A2P6RWZ8_ROSCH|nr:uncharacterized protein LOC112183315 isoform X2 [Rosa chinensis]PRQ50960.1 hypothetical protein RchiOBHm_Chr2g0139011 [Rosa chinensis]
MDSNFSGAIAKLRGASDDEISMGQRGDLMKLNSSEEPDRLGKKPGKDIPHPAKPDISAAAASINPKLAALSLGNRGKRLCSGPKGRISQRRNRKEKGASIGLGIKSKEPKAIGVSDKNNKKVAAVASSTSVVTERGGCQICGHDHQHIRCPYLEVVPPGGTVGPDYLVVCGECGYELKQPIPASCWSCGYFGGRVVGASTFDYSFRYHLDEYYIEVPVTAEYMDPGNYTDQKPVMAESLW